VLEPAYCQRSFNADARALSTFIELFFDFCDIAHADSELRTIKMFPFNLRNAADRVRLRWSSFSLAACMGRAVTPKTVFSGETCSMVS
jgi:hypothetical protein